MPGLLTILLAVIALYAIAKLVVKITGLALDAAFVIAIILIALKLFGAI